MELAVIIFFSLIIFHINSLAADDAIRPNQTLQDNGQTLVSAGDMFKLGFFSPQNSENRYVGIWFNNFEELTVTAMWVANRDNPLNDSSGVLKITETGNIVILSNQTGNPVWSSNSTAKDPTLQLLNTGNLVVKDGNGGNYTWQSFDHPCDSLLAGMKLGWDLTTGQSWKLTSWNSIQDPSKGNYTYELDSHGIPQTILRMDQDIVSRRGPWDGVRFGGDPPIQEVSSLKTNYVMNKTHNYFTFENSNSFTITRFYLKPLGSVDQLEWDYVSGSWVTIYEVHEDDCDTFARCGPNGICDNSEKPICRCLTGFEPKEPEAWAAMNSSTGCVLKTRLNFSASEGFKKLSGLKLPYGRDFNVNGAVVWREECEEICRSSCSCVAYAVARVGGCVVWSGDMLDIRRFSEGGQDLYIRMAASEFAIESEDGKMIAVIISITLVIILLLCLAGGYLIRKTTSRSLISQEETGINSHEDQGPVLLEDDVELPSFGLDTISKATNNFSSTNKIGEGGFGPVYKGVLSTGEEIAAKKLSRDSRQGPVEFKNEVILISKLQHRNLVRLLGCCIHREERMLIYEFMPKKSLNLYIFNQIRETALDWKKRFDIIVGIARGFLYLHRDSRLKIIHRDLKASNILLDNELNPKISDFGLARIFGSDQTGVITTRVVGTYGYMSLEYMIDGHFSEKSDVFSFGVMVLEIVSGKKNRESEHLDHNLNLIGHAWKLWSEKRPMELIDVLMENVTASEVLRCIHVGLLCVQKFPEERPLMSSALSMIDGENGENVSALSMIDGENVSLPQPRLPGFYTERYL